MPYVGVYDWLKREIYLMLHTMLFVRVTLIYFNVRTVNKVLFRAMCID